MKEKSIQLLNLTAKIVEKHNAIAMATGQNFNIFSILGMEYSEVKTHSAFLAEMLNPKGSHHQGDLFLRLFIDQLRIKDFDTKNASVEVEKFTGFIDNNSETGGQIDLFISDNSTQKPKVIIIENKIYAGDQYNQLVRYYNYGKEISSNGNIFLYYLTPSGYEPSTASKGKLKMGNDFYLLSYTIDIITWLEECLKAAALIENLRVNINQYLNIIKKMTGQAQDKKLTAELSELFADKANYNSFFELNTAMKNFKVEALKNFWEMLLHHFDKKNIKYRFSYKEAENNKAYLFKRIENYHLGSRDFYNFGLYFLLGNLNDKIEIFFKIGMWYQLYFGVQAVNPQYETIKRKSYTDKLIEFKNKLLEELSKNNKWGCEDDFILSAYPKINFNFSEFNTDVHHNFYNNENKPKEFDFFCSELDQDMATVKRVINNFVQNDK